jgi:hypothetical protein
MHLIWVSMILPIPLKMRQLSGNLDSHFPF